MTVSYERKCKAKHTKKRAYKPVLLSTQDNEPSVRKQYCMIYASLAFRPEVSMILYMVYCPAANTHYSQSRRMCYHKLYIFTTCGHSFFGPMPLMTCRHASISPDSSYSSTCEIKAHPYQSLKLERLCVRCQRQRSVLLERLEGQQIVRVDEQQWKVSYSVPRTPGFESEQSSKDRKKSEKRSKIDNKSSGGRVS